MINREGDRGGIGEKAGCVRGEYETEAESEGANEVSVTCAIIIF